MAVARFWGFWTRGKLDLLAAYLNAFVRASKRSRDRVYLDLFAGGPEGQYRRTGEPIAGSPRIALSAGPPLFTVLRFFEKEPTATALRTALAAEFPGRDFDVIAGDCNATIASTLDGLRAYSRAAAFAFLDPDGPEYQWSTLESLAAFKHQSTPKIELFMLFPAGLFIRTLPKDGSVSPADRGRLTDMYGSAAWESIYEARVDGRLTPAQAREEYVNLMRWRLERVLGYKSTHTLKVRNTRNTPIYHLVFATDHRIGDKIMSDVYTAGSKQFDELRRADAQLRLAQEEEELGVLRLLTEDELRELAAAPEPRGKRYVHEPPWVPFGLTAAES